MLPLAACNLDDILRVEDPEFATPETLDNAAGLPVIVAGAIGDFQIGYTGAGGDGFLSVQALLGDEFYQTDTFETRRRTDQRRQFLTGTPNTSDIPFNRLQYGRRSLKDAADAVARLASATDPRIAELKALGGYTYIALADGWCSAIPFSATLTGGRLGDFGAPANTQQVYDSAVARFNEALAVSASNHLAAVGKGRALLAKGQYQAAAAAVANVPDDFVYFVRHSTNSVRQNNPIFALQDNGRYGVSDDEGGPILTTRRGGGGDDGNGLKFRSGDPRILVSDSVPGFEPAIPSYRNLLYPNLDADIPISSGLEARLIQAEAALQSGNTTQWLQILNSLRGNATTLMRARYPTYTATATLAPLTDPGTAQGRIDLMFSERAFWLYNTGTRLGDLRRLVREYKRPQDQVYPTGPFHRGGTYGNDVAFPVPFDEVNNPQFTPSQCNVEQA